MLAKLLLLEHPQYGYIGLVSGKVRFGETILETAKREFAEESTLETDFKVIGALRQIRKDKSGQVREKVQRENISGRRLIRSKKIEKLFKPSVEIILEEVQKRLSGKIPWNLQFIFDLKPPVEDY